MSKKPKQLKVKKKFTYDDFELVLISLPTIVWYIVFSYLPLLGIIIAFKEWKFVPGKTMIQAVFSSDLEWLGFTNFEFIFASTSSMQMIRNTLLYNIVFIIIGVVLPVTLAIMITNMYSQRLAKACQTAMFLPHFMSWVVGSYFLFAFLSNQHGLLNNLIVAIGGENAKTINWYSAEAVDYWPYIIVLMNIWKTTGYGMVVYLASITGIDTTYYEAAVIDGASKWQQITKITLPLLKNIIIIMLIMAFGKIFNSDFGLFYQVPKNVGALTSVTQTLDVYVYKSMTGLLNYGMAQAAALFQSVCGCITILLANFIVKKIDEDSAFF